MKKRIVFLLCIIALVSSCSKDENLREEISKDFEKIDNQETYEMVSKKEAFIIVSNIAKLSTDENFKKLMYEEISKKFDGDYNTLLNNLIKQMDSQMLKNASIDSDYKSTLSSLNERGLYPQVYIPSFNKVTLKSSKNDAPIYIIDALNASDTVQNVKSIFINPDGEIKETEFLIDENYANENEVWVVSLNERVLANKGEININDNKSSRVGVKSEYMMKINCPNLSKIEGWIKGAPELRCVLKSAKGEISDQYFYPSRRRDIDNTWWNINDYFGRYLYYWDIESYSKTVLYAWIEVDNAGTTLEFSGSFTYKDVDKESGQEFTATANYKITYKAWDHLCGSMSVHFDDGMVGNEYSTGLIKFIDSYK